MTHNFLGLHSIQAVSYIGRELAGETRELSKNYDVPRSGDRVWNKVKVKVKNFHGKY